MTECVLVRCVAFNGVQGDILKLEKYQAGTVWKVVLTAKHPDGSESELYSENFKSDVEADEVFNKWFARLDRETEKFKG
jgi:hypothetical protein|nr:MAG TPA: hypothetical protein [Caudoviricetes sp.]